jgi:hypothetical protein
VSLLISF